MTSIEIKENISKLYDECLERNDIFHKKIDLFQIPESIAKIVENKFNIDIYNHWITIDNYGIEHTLKQHGNPIIEAKRGQIAIVKEDFLHFVDIITNPDKIEMIGFTKRTNLPLLQFEKELSNKKIVIKEVRTVTSTKKKKISRLVFHTMYKKKFN